jgi:RNA polymerase-binding transcription factor DksA
VESVGPPEPADTTEPVDDEEWHRSAVDAVDGLLDEVERALTRLDDGTYGRCEDCGETIDDERLAALPVVRTCGGCDGPHGGPETRQPVEPASA